MRRLVVMAVFFCEFLTARTDTFVVLPFSNTSKDQNLDWIGESISEFTREVLFSEGVLVLDREDRAEAYRRLGIRQYALLTRASVIHIAHSLDAGQVIFGEFQLTPVQNSPQQSRGALRISASILDLRGPRRGPRFEEVGPLEDLALLQNRIAWRVLTYAMPGSAAQETEFHKRRPPLRVEAIENHVRGLLAPAVEHKMKLFAEAARLDPAFSQPRFQLGRLHWDRKEYKQAAEWFEKVTASDAHYRESRFFLGLCRYYLGDYAPAEKAFQLVAEEVPLNEVFNNLGAAQLQRSPAAALDNFRKALDGDRNDPDYHFNIGYALWMLHDFNTAADHFRAVLDRDPDDADAMKMLGRALKPVRAPATPSRSGAQKIERLERLKHEYQESAYWQLKAALEPRK